MRDRRAVVFVIFAVVSLVLTPFAPAEFRWVCLVTGGTYVVLAVASALDARSRSGL